MEGGYLIANLGSAADIYYEADRYPEKGSFADAKDLGIFAGGPVLNVACVASSRGMEVKALDYLKTGDATTSAILGKLKEHGVDTSGIQTSEDVSNCKVVVLKTGEERTYLVMLADRPPFEITEQMRELLSGAGYLYTLLPGYTDAFETDEVIREARSHGMLVCFDGTDSYEEPERVRTLLTAADGLFINTESYENLRKALNGKSPADALFENGVKFICITDGENGAMCCTPTCSFRAESLRVNVVDSTGAGDSFAGTFLAALSSGCSYERALRLACAGGAYACTVFGGQGGACSMERLITFAEENDYPL